MSRRILQASSKDPLMPTRVLCRYGEIFLKRGRRRYFIEGLCRNARAVLADLEGVRVRAPHGRMIVEAGEQEPSALTSRLGRVFGLTDLSPVQVLDRRDGEDADSLRARIAETAVELARRGHGVGASTFRISARRSDKSFPYSSSDLAPWLGGEVLEALPDLRVKLKGADLDIEVELRPEEVFVNAGREPAPGGLPVGSNGRSLLLLSGGIDSPVAGWLMQKRGVRVDAVTFDSFPLTSPQATEKVKTLCGLLSRWAPALTLHIVPFSDLQLMFREEVPAQLLLLLYRRAMFRIADRLASRIGALALVTGESVGQVASQTLHNMRAIEAVTPTPVIRPIATNDKAETVAMAKKLGTYPISILPYQDCCSLFVPEHPELKGKHERLSRLEGHLDRLAELEDEALAKRQVLHYPSYGIGEVREA
jgi:tRNA uracil 4-sulfurtransferase